MEKSESINVRITKKEQDFIRRTKTNISKLFREALKKEMALSPEQVEQRMAEKISDALGIKITNLVVLSRTSDVVNVQFSYVLECD